MLRVPHCSSYTHALQLAPTHHAWLNYIKTYSMQSCERTDRQHSRPRGHQRHKITAASFLPWIQRQGFARQSTCNCYGVTVSFASAGKACDCPSSQLTDTRSVLAQAVCCLFGHRLHPRQCETASDNSKFNRFEHSPAHDELGMCKTASKTPQKHCQSQSSQNWTQNSI